VYGRNSKE